MEAAKLGRDKNEWERKGGGMGRKDHESDESTRMERDVNERVMSRLVPPREDNDYD